MLCEDSITPSPLNDTEKRRKRNRQSAAASRKKKKDEVEAYKETIARLHEENLALKAQVKSFIEVCIAENCYVNELWSSLRGT